MTTARSRTRLFPRRAPMGTKEEAAIAGAIARAHYDHDARHNTYDPDRAAGAAADAIEATYPYPSAKARAAASAASYAAYAAYDNCLRASDPCQCGTATGVFCPAKGRIWADYCPAENAGTAAAAGSWQGLTVRLWLAVQCEWEIRTIFDEHGDTTTYPNAYDAAAARDGR